MDIIHGICIRQICNDEDMPVIPDEANEHKHSLPNMTFDIKPTPEPFNYASQMHCVYSNTFEQNQNMDEDEENENDGDECAVSGRLEIRVIPPGK
jgi:hypothetical protein